MGEKLFCPNCGTGVRSDWVQCPKCLRSLNYADPRGSQYTRNYPRGEIKNPGIAAILCFFITGLGQIYNGQIGKGLILIILYGIAILTSFILIGIIPLIIIWIYGIYDAYNTAKEINERGYE